MSETTWQRLWRIAEARREYLGITRTGLQAAGGPSTEWVRKLQAGSGQPSVRHAASLRKLDHALGWEDGTSRGLLTDDRSSWSGAVLADEEQELIYGKSIRPVNQPAESRTTQAVRALTRLFQSDDPIPGMTDHEWDELLEAIEARREQAQQEQRRASGH